MHPLAANTNTLCPPTTIGLPANLANSPDQPSRARDDLQPVPITHCTMTPNRLSVVLPAVTLSPILQHTPVSRLRYAGFGDTEGNTYLASKS
jgi:hypothetical protein